MHRIVVLLMTSIAVNVAGCGGKGTTNISYAPPISPIGITFNLDNDGKWTVGAGAVTPVGVFALSHSFDPRPDLTYIVLRNRNTNTDQVFSMTSSGHVDVHAVGEHKLRMNREENRWIIETDTISGNLEIQVIPSTNASARIDFGENDPAFVVMPTRMLVIEHPSSFKSSDTISLESLKSIELRSVANLKFIRMVKRDNSAIAPMVSINNSDASAYNFSTLERSVKGISPNVDFKTTTAPWYVTALLWISRLVLGVGVLVAFGYAGNGDAGSAFFLLFLWVFVAIFNLQIPYMF